MQETATIPEATIPETTIPETGPRRALQRIVELVLLAAATLIFAHFVARRIGINVDDDSGTLFLSRTPFWRSGELVYGQWSPLYLLWFRLLDLVCSRPMRLYFLDWQVLVGVVALLPPLLRVRNAWLYTLAVLTLPVLFVGPYMGLFAAVFPVLWLSVLLRRPRSYSTVLACGSLLCFVMEFVRPEYGYSVYLCAAGTCVAALLEWRRSAQRRLLVGKVGLALLLTVGMHAVLSKGLDHRSGMSLEQHFNLRAQEAGQLPAGESPWFSNYAQLRFGVDVTHHPPDTTAELGDFIRANPRLFVSHLLDNLRDGRTWAVLLLFAAATVWPWLLSRAAPLRPVALLLLLLCAAPAAGVIVVYPRDHYPVPVTPALVLLAVQAWGLYGPRRMTWQVVSAVILVLCGFVYLTKIRLNNATFMAQRYIQTDIECAVKTDQTLPDNGPAGVSYVFIPMPNVTGYLPHRRLGVSLGQDFTKWPEIADWVRQKRPVLVELSDWNLEQMKVSPAEVQQFMQGEMGYTSHPCGVGSGLNMYTADRR